MHKWLNPCVTGGGVNEWMNEWRNEGMKEWRNEGMKEWRNEGMKEWRNERMKEWRNEGMKEWRNEGRKEWMKEGMNEWMGDWGGWNEMNMKKIYDMFEIWNHMGRKNENESGKPMQMK